MSNKFDPNERLIPSLDINSLSYSLIPKDNPKDKIKTVVGDDKDNTQFYPQVKIQRWDNEVNSSIRLQLPGLDDEVVTQEDEKVILEKGIYKAVMYDKPDASDEGGFEFEIHLQEKPLSNVFEFSVNTKELNWYYQPELSQEDIDEGAIRPENVVGSYAVYHKTKGVINDAAGMDYKTGKAFHVYRPHAVDSNGDKIWGELNLDGSTLTITLDQNWLDKAAYPVIVDPTFGYTTDAATSISAGNTIRFTAATIPEDSKGVSMSFKASGSLKMKSAIYDDPSSLPTDILTNGAANEITLDNSTGWKTGNFATQPTLTGSNNVTLAVWSESGNTFYDDNVTGNTSWRKTSQTYGATWPQVSSFTTTYSNRAHAIYVTYTAGEETTTTSSSTSTSTSSSTSSSTSTSTTTTLSPTSGGLAFGEETPDSPESAISWATWGGTGAITGDAAWGKLQLDFNEYGYSRVYSFGDAQTRQITLTANKYGTGQENATLQIRGQSTVFAVDAASPDWENYTGAVSKDWKFIQVRAIYNS